jgi:hypothetical protein
MLVKDRSTFHSMFSLDTYRISKEHDATWIASPSSGEGVDDDNPIVLQGDTADEFRALLWSIYSLYAL